MMISEKLMAAISDKEMCLMTKYIDTYGVANSVGAKEILQRGWAKQKGTLFKLFGEKLILEKEVEFVKSPMEIAAEMYDNAEFSVARDQFYRKLRVLVPEKINTSWYNFSNITDMGTLASNTVPKFCEMEFIDPTTNKPFKVHGGMKVMKVLAKLAEICDVMPEFEAFRLEHSRMLNQKRIKGQVCISIHPFDYMTMSDNSNGWSSCMSWRNEGEYRSGTVEMMNSDCVVVAYLKSASEFFEWNSKKWRCLFIVREGFISNIKAYPYQNDDIEEFVCDWLKDLCNKNLAPTDNRWAFGDAEPVQYEYSHGSRSHIKYKKSGIESNFSLRFYTNSMYNDFGARDYQWGVFNPAIIEELYDNSIYCTYSGPAQCMKCGEVDICVSEPQDLTCDDCSDYRCYCDNCGCRVYDDDAYWHGDACYCPDCFNDYFNEDALTGDYEHEDDLEPIYVVPAACEEHFKANVSNYNIGRTYSHFHTYYSQARDGYYESLWRWKTYFNEDAKIIKAPIGRFNNSYYVIAESIRPSEADLFFENFVEDAWDYDYSMSDYITELTEQYGSFPSEDEEE